MKKILRFLILTVLVLSLFPATAFAHTSDAPFVTDLIAGGGNDSSAIDVGDVIVWNDGDSLYVQYVVNAEGWCLEETHLEIATTLDAIPQKNGNPIPGHFTYSDSLACASDWSYQIPITWDVGTPVMIAAHAVVKKVEGWTEYELLLPKQVSMVVTFPGTTYGAPSYFDVAVSGGTMLDGMHDGYCVDLNAGLIFGALYQADVYSSYSPESLPPGRISNPENFDLVNYILNQHYVGKTSPTTGTTYTYGDVQRAIWTLIEGTVCSNCTTGPSNPVHVQEIVSNALEYGEGFLPPCGGTLAIVLVPSSSWGQILIIEVPAPCLEDTYETAWGDGLDFPGKNWATYFTYTIQ